MFEDFENRSGFWKDLGSNFTINYSGDAPSFLTSGEMWATMDGSETQTLAAWENGWVLTNNPDGTMTATPKYTSGLISQTLVRVPVGPQAPMSSPTGGVGGVQVAFSAQGTEKQHFWKNKVQIFEHCMSDENFTFGWEKTLDVGEYDRETLEPNDKNDNISAIHIPEGYKVVAHQNYIGDADTGTVWEWNGPLNKTCLADGSGTANDQISYLKITCLDGYIEDQAGGCSRPTSTNQPNGGSNGGSIITPCADANRKVKTDGSCATGCKTDYEFHPQTGLCVESSSDNGDDDTTDDDTDDDNGDEDTSLDNGGTNYGLWIGGALVLGLIGYSVI